VRTRTHQRDNIHLKFLEMAINQTIAYADCFSGVSGDMFLGALLHCGLPLETLKEELAKLHLAGFDLTVSTPTICGIGSCRVEVNGDPQKHNRHLSSIRCILEKSDLDERTISTSLDVFTLLAKAEAKVHNIEVEKVHFHEVGALDTIVDIVGTVVGLHHLGITRLHTSSLPMPRGFVKCAHGKLPLPAPAVSEILQGVPCYGVAVDHELITPTGAALLKVLTAEFGVMPPMIITSTGYGAGSTILPDAQPNLFRLFVGQPQEVTEYQQVEVIETNLDDWVPEGYPHLCEVLFDQGALDVNLTPTQVKKGRPGFQLQVICPQHLAYEIKTTLFTETTSIGLRFRRENRYTLPRETVQVNTAWGKLAAKKVVSPSGIQIYPEYEECRKIAKEYKIPLQKVYDAVREGSKNT